MSEHPSTSWRDLIFLQSTQVPHHTPAMRDVLRLYALEGPQRAAERLARAFEMTDLLGWSFKRHLALDVGCGTGGALSALSASFDRVVACDIDPPHLVIAQKCIEENKLGNVELKQADALHLPFPDETFDFVMGIDFLHHVDDPGAVLMEIRRVLKKGGVAALDSTNRYTLLATEPHVKLAGVGWLPRTWQAPYVQWRLGISYEAHHVRLLSLRALRQVLSMTFDQHHALYSPFFGKQNPKFAGAMRWMRLHARRVAELGHALFLLLIPNHEFLARKESP